VSHGWPGGDCCVWDWRFAKRIVEYKRDYSIAVFDFHPDSQSIILGGRANGDLILYRLSDGQPIHSWKVPGGAEFPVFEPKHGRCVARAQVNSGDVLVLDAQSGEQLIRWKKPAPHLQRLAWQPDGPILAAAAVDSRIYTFDTVTRKPLVVLEGHQAQVKEI